MDGFIWGLALLLCVAKQHMISTCSSSSQGFDHMRTVERVCIGTYGGGIKSTCHLYSIITIPSESRDSFNKD